MIPADNKGGGGVYGPPPSPVSAPGVPAQVAVNWQLIAQFMVQYQAALKTSGTGAASDGVTDANGAPFLPEGGELSGDDIALALMNLNSQMLASSISPLQARLEIQKDKQQKLVDASVKKIMESLEKAIEAKAKAKASSIFGWISKIVSVITTVVALPMIAAQGPTGMLAATLIVTGLVAAMANPGEGGFEETDLSMSALAARGAATLYEAGGMSPEQAREAAAFTSGVVGLVSYAVIADPSFAGQLGQASATAAGASEADAQMVALACTLVAAVVSAVVFASFMGGAPEGAEAIATAAQIANIMAKIAQATVTMTKALNDMELAELKKEMGKLGVDADRIDAAIARVAQLMQENQDLIKSVIEISQAKTEIASDILKSSQMVQSHAANSI